MKDVELEDKMSELEDMEMEMEDEESPFSLSKENMARKAMANLASLWPDGGPDTKNTPFMSLVKLYVQAINDAVSADVIDETLACEMPQTDSDLNYLIGKLGVLGKHPHKKAFAKFLAEPVEAPVKEEPVVQPEPEESDPVLALLKSYK